MELLVCGRCHRHRRGHRHRYSHRQSVIIALAPIPAIAVTTTNRTALRIAGCIRCEMLRICYNIRKSNETSHRPLLK